MYIKTHFTHFLYFVFQSDNDIFFFFRTLSHIDKHLGSSYNSKFILGAKIAFWLLLCTAILFSKMHVWTSGSLIRILRSLYWCFITFQILIFICFISETASILTTRQKLYQDELRIFCNGMYFSKNYLVHKRKALKNLWRNFYFVTSHLNYVFGKQMFMLLVVNFIEFLHSVNEILDIFVDKEIENIQKLLYKCFKIFFLCVSIFNIYYFIKY